MVRKALDRYLEILRQKDLLPAKINAAFDQLEELLVKEKGYLLQNAMYRKRTGLNIIRTAELRKNLFQNVQADYPFVKERYDAFSKEISSWNLETILKDLFQ